MKAIITLLLVSLLLTSNLTQATRPIPKDVGKELADEKMEEAKIEGCEGVSDEECLVRRTLVAHTDYIYTQGAHHKP